LNDASPTKEWVLAGGLSVQAVDITDGTEDSRMDFWTIDASSYAVRMSINEDGNVGIGTTSPSYLLEVNGAGSETALNVSDALFVNGSNVGINTTDPKAPLSFATTVGQKIEFYNAGTNNEFGIGVESGELRISTGASSKIAFRTDGYNGNERMVIDTDGDIGIGTASPSTKLDVNGSLNISDSSGKIYTPELCLDGVCQTSWPSGGGGGNGWLNSSTQVYLADPTDHLNVSDNLWVNSSSGRVGIGTTNPAEELHISSTTPALQFTDTDASNADAKISSGGGNIRIQADENNENAGSFIRFDIDGADSLMYINYSGNVGISDISPGYKLEVNGSLNVESTAGSSYFFVNQSDGNVGIGTTTPSNDLEVRGNLTVSSSSTNRGYFEVSDGLVNIKSSKDGAVGTAIALFTQTSAGATTERVRINENGSVGIGTVPTGDDKLEILRTSGNMGLRIRGDTGVQADMVFDSPTGGVDQKKVQILSTGGLFTVRGINDTESAVTYNLFVANLTNGNVGIGTTSPGAKLDISWGGYQGTSAFFRSLYT